MRAAVIIAALALACPAAAWPRVAAGDAIETLADQLKTGLRAQAPGDAAFCDEVARLVAADAVQVSGPGVGRASGGPFRCGCADGLQVEQRLG